MYPGRRTYDPDLDIQPRPPSLGPTEPVEAFQRLVANPFLTFFAWLVAFGLVVQSLHRLNLALFVAGLALLFLAFLLLQFHCLDCGATGWLLRASAHACPAVIARRQIGRSRRSRVPGLKWQLVAWFIVTLAGFVLGMMAVGSGR